jgi:AraC-like DNA-binding protein
LSIDDLARTARMSRFHFSRVFRDEVGKSPYQLLVETRIERAQALLKSGQAVTEAALSVGFMDLSRFSKAFRRQVGCSPSEYRKSA